MNILAVILIVLLCCFIVGLIVLRGFKGPTRSLETVKRPIQDLLVRGYNGGFLIIDVSGTNYFIQLRKYIISSNNYGIELSFPKAKWSEQFFRSLTEYCDLSQVKYSISKSTEPHNELDFLNIDFGKDTHKAHNFVKTIITEIFGLKEDVELFVRLENATLI
ncbi:hypothetical protein [Candidatus Electrothrix sp.]|uniref:hypothetical protein n=1 Tax=Candidatus Electrothrix sp. TaxID=2170559 RepID=UPI004056B0C6